MVNNWFYCEKCSKHYNDKKQAEECLRFGHIIVRRLPVSLRTVHKALAYGESPTILVNVDGDKWLVALHLACFKSGVFTEWSKTDEWYWYGNVVLDPPLANIIAKLNHMHPNNKISEDKLLKLIRQSIKTERYEDRGKNQAVVLLAFDSDLKLRKRTPKSKYVTVSISKIRKLVKEEEDSIDEAWQHAGQHKAPEV